jgi:hypothetical protein
VEASTSSVRALSFFGVSNLSILPSLGNRFAVTDRRSRTVCRAMSISFQDKASSSPKRAPRVERKTDECCHVCVVFLSVCEEGAPLFMRPE